MKLILGMKVTKPPCLPCQLTKVLSYLVDILEISHLFADDVNKFLNQAEQLPDVHPHL